MGFFMAYLSEISIAIRFIVIYLTIFLTGCQVYFSCYLSKKHLKFQSMGERKVFSTRIDQDILKKLKHLAVDRNSSLNDLLEEAIQDLLKKYQNVSSKQ